MGSSGIVVSSNKNHYNKQLNRCFVLVDENAVGFYTVNRLYDAVERSLLISCSSTEKTSYCLDFEGGQSERLSSVEGEKRIKAYMAQ